MDDRFRPTDPTYPRDPSSAKRMIEHIRPAAPSIVEKVRFLCTVCWSVFDEGTRESCPTCAAKRPAEGWETMPYRFRNRFRFSELIARGGMGAVFHAFNLDAGGDVPVEVAVKVVQKIGTPEEYAQYVTMFGHEVGAASLLGESSSFVKIYGYERNLPPCLIMEFVPWKTLRDVISAGPSTSIQAARIIRSLLAGLEVMHYVRMVHRDLKPANIFVSLNTKGEYDIKIADLGIWTLDESEKRRGSLAGPLGKDVVAGTLEYMSPEQLDRVPVGCQSDLHGVGSIFWELLTGRIPFPARGKTYYDRLLDRRRAVEQIPPRPDAIPPELYAILLKALAFRPADRFKSAGEMDEALEQFIESRVARHRIAIESAETKLTALTNRLDKIKTALANTETILDKVRSVEVDLVNLRGREFEWEPDALDAKVREISDNLTALIENIFTATKDEISRLLGSSVTPDGATLWQRYRVVVAGLAVVLAGLLGYLAGMPPSGAGEAGGSVIALAEAEAVTPEPGAPEAAAPEAAAPAPGTTAPPPPPPSCETPECRQQTAHRAAMHAVWRTVLEDSACQEARLAFVKAVFAGDQEPQTDPAYYAALTGTTIRELFGTVWPADTDVASVRFDPASGGFEAELTIATADQVRRRARELFCTVTSRDGARWVRVPPLVLDDRVFPGGALATRIEDDLGTAASLGICRGDLVTQIGANVVSSPTDVGDWYNAHGDPVVIQAVSKGQILSTDKRDEACD